MIPLLLLLFSCARSPEPVDEPGHEDGEHDEGEAVPGHGGAEGHGESVMLTPEARAAAKLSIAPAEARAWTGGFGTVARVKLDPRREARIGVSADGQVERLLLQPGDPVSVGTVIAEIRSPALGEAVGNYHTRASERKLATARLERARELAASGTTSPAQLAEAEAADTAARAAYEAAEERLRVLGVEPGKFDGGHFPSRFPVRSPVAGELLASEVSVGQAVTPGAELFHVGNLDRVWVMLDVFERDLARVAKGQAVRFTVDAWPAEVFSGAVDWVGSVVEEGSRTVEVRVVADNPDHRLKPGMFGRADLGEQDGGGPTAIVVPAEAVQEVEGSMVVFVEAGDAFEARPVSIGQRTASEVQILSGLTPGEPVVVGGAFTLKSELAKAELGEGHAH
ncbi:MAG: efflux RND transporter periplasmic adaptor subunit [Myxococcota bacterium]